MCAQRGYRQRRVGGVGEELAVRGEKQEGVEGRREVEGEERGEALCQKEWWRTRGHFVMDGVGLDSGRCRLSRGVGWGGSCSKLWLAQA